MGYTFKQARWYYSGRRAAVRLIVVHDMETAEKLTAAEAVADYFARGERRASAHLNFDADSEVQSVRFGDTAFGAASANADGIHLEHAGYARQDRLEWMDPFSTATLDRSAWASAALCKQFGIPVRRLSVEQVRDRRSRGFCGHIDVSAAFPSSGHWDPGFQFPWDFYLSRVSAYLGEAPLVPAPALDLSHPALLVKVGSPEQRFLRDYLSLATKRNAKGDPYRDFQIVEIDPARPPAVVPRDSVGMGTRVPGWAQIAGEDRYETFGLMLRFLGIG